MTTITTTEAGATGRYIDLGTSPANNVDVGAQTIIAYCKPTGSGGGGFGYMFGKTTAGSTAGLRFFIDHNGNAPNLSCGVDSSGVANHPLRVGTANEVVYNSWAHYGLTWDGTLNHTGLHLYIEGTESTYGRDTDTGNGTGSVNSDAAKNLFLMNRGNAGNLGREFVGDVGYIARWNRVLNSTEMTSVFNNGPLSVPSGLILCWANQADLSTNAITPAGRSTHVDGSTPPNTALGDVTALAGAATDVATATGAISTAIPLAGAAADVATATGAVTTSGGAALAGDAVDIATAIGAISTSDPLAGSASDVATATGDLVVPMSILAGYERSSVNLSGSSVTGAGDSAVIVLKPRVQESEVVSSQTRWLEPSAKVTGMNGFRPTFRFSDYAASETTGTYHGAPWQTARRPMFSYDRLTWTYFDTQTVNTTYIEFRHNTAFTADTIYVSRGRQVSVAQIGDWIATIAAANPTLIEPTIAAATFTPSLTSWPAQSYIADEFSSQVDELSQTIPATPFYALQINDTSLMPPSGVKKLAVITSGVHAGEDLPFWPMKAFVEYVLGSSITAQYLRMHFKILIYPMFNAPGRVGGGWRGSFTQGTAGADDANRHFSDATPGLEIVTKPRTAIVTDMAGGVPEWMFDWHGDFAHDYGIYLDNTAQTNFKTVLDAKTGVTHNNDGNTISGFVSRYFQDTTGVPLAVTVEFGDTAPIADATYVTYGQNFAAALQAYVQALDMAGDAQVIASASGTFVLSVNLTGNALAQALATANTALAVPLVGNALEVASSTAEISTQIALSGAAFGQAAAVGAINVSLPGALAGDAGVQASGTGAASVTLPLAGNVQIIATAFGSLDLGDAITGSATVVVTATGDMMLTIEMSGAAFAQAIAMGGLSIQMPLTGAAITQAFAAGALIAAVGAQYPLAGIFDIRPLNGISVQYPLAGIFRTYP